MPNLNSKRSHLWFGNEKFGETQLFQQFQILIFCHFDNLIFWYWRHEQVIGQKKKFVKKSYIFSHLGVLSYQNKTLWNIVSTSCQNGLESIFNSRTKKKNSWRIDLKWLMISSPNRINRFQINQSINQTKLSFLDEKIRNESSKRGSTSSVASRFLNFSGPTAAAIFLTAARHATSTPSLPTRADSFLHNSTSRPRPSSRTTSSASRLSLHNLEQTKQQKPRLLKMPPLPK